MEVNPEKSSDKSDQRYFENKLHLIDIDSAIGLWKDGTEWWTVLFWKQNQRDPIKRFSPDANIQAGLVFWRKIGFQSPTRHSNNWNIFQVVWSNNERKWGRPSSYYYFYYFLFLITIISIISYSLFDFLPIWAELDHQSESVSIIRELWGLAIFESWHLWQYSALRSFCQ